jgi:hypothetical protein
MGEEGHGTDIKMVAVVKCNQAQLGKWNHGTGRKVFPRWCGVVARGDEGGEGWRGVASNVVGRKGGGLADQWCAEKLSPPAAQISLVRVPLIKVSPGREGKNVILKIGAGGDQIWSVWRQSLLGRVNSFLKRHMSSDTWQCGCGGLFIFRR